MEPPLDLPERDENTAMAARNEIFLKETIILKGGTSVLVLPAKRSEDARARR